MTLIVLSFVYSFGQLLYNFAKIIAGITGSFETPLHLKQVKRMQGVIQSLDGRPKPRMRNEH